MKLGLRVLPILTTLILCEACGWFTPAHEADIIKVLGCVLTESAKVAPNRMPTLEEAAQIALTCGVDDADTVIDMVSAHRTASRLERGE